MVYFRPVYVMSAERDRARPPDTARRGRAGRFTARDRRPTDRRAAPHRTAPHRTTASVPPAEEGGGGDGGCPNDSRPADGELTLILAEGAKPETTYN